MNQDLLELTITGTGSDMQGIGRQESGRAVFVPGALPSEEVCARIVVKTERYAVAQLLTVLKPNPLRAAPPCPVYGRCGGCQGQHMDYQLTLEIKRQQVTDAIERIGGFAAPEVLPVAGMHAPYRYRNKAEYAIDTTSTEGVHLGFYAQGSHRIVPFTDCMLQHPLSVQAASFCQDFLNRHSGGDNASHLRHLVTRINHKGQLMCILSGTKSSAQAWSLLTTELRAHIPKMIGFYYCELKHRAGHALDGRIDPVWVDQPFVDQLQGMDFELSPQSFFQVNPEQTQVLYLAALEAAALSGTETVVDAYCGVGSISLLLARRARKVIGIEIVPEAIQNAQANARRNRLDPRTQFHVGDAPQIMQALAQEGLRPDVLVVDPPRKGLDARFVRAALSSAPARIVYVSCNPSTLARDAKLLCQDGQYRLQSVQPVDMFCWTSHVETVVLMSRVEK